MSIKARKVNSEGPRQQIQGNLVQKQRTKNKVSTEKIIENLG